MLTLKYTAKILQNYSDMFHTHGKLCTKGTYKELKRQVFVYCQKLRYFGFST
jgi:hypothetical protein